MYLECPFCGGEGIYSLFLQECEYLVRCKECSGTGSILIRHETTAEEDKENKHYHGL